MTITASQVIEESARIPALADTDLAAALPSHVSLLSGDSQAELRDQINEALRTYVVDRLTDIGIRGISPSARLKRLVKVEKAIDNVLRLIWLEGGSIAEFTQLELRCAPPRVKGSPEPPESDTNLERVKESVELLLRKTRLALKRVRKIEENQKKLAAKGKMKARASHARNTGDQAMKDLFVTLTAIWVDTLQTLPGASVDPNTGEVGGPFVRFVQGIFAAFANRIPDELKAIDPGLNAKLEMKPPAIRAYLRRTRTGLLKKVGASENRLPQAPPEAPGAVLPAPEQAAIPSQPAQSTAEPAPESQEPASAASPAPAQPSAQAAPEQTQ